MVATADKRPWRLVGPWYRWDRPGLPSTGRTSRPVFQKYDSPKLVEEFLADPQHSLKFTDDDFVHKVTPLPKLNPEFLPNDKRPRRLSLNKYARTDVRKLFLDTHKRFYLVVCELHCDGTGFPTATRDQACEAGFVVRRRVSRNLPKIARKEVKPILKELGAARGVLNELVEIEPQEKLSILKKGLASQGEAMLASAVAQSVNNSMAAAVEKISVEQAKFDAWVVKYGVELYLQGWQVVRDRIGKWTSVEENPTTLTEQVLPLYPLIPDPRLEDHSARGRNIYFGMIPAGSADTDEFGQARFDDMQQYEIRCYVRRHKPGCPVKTKKPDCHGELVWSAPTETYQLASHFDLVGTSNRPVTIQLPDIEALRAQAAAMKPNQLAPVRMVSPPKSSLEFSADKDGKVTGPNIPQSGFPQICSFSIPLITIVATFVFKLFLPVLILLFGLFFLLKLKFCIPPTIDIDIEVEVKAALAIQAPSFEADFDVSVDADFEVGNTPANKLGNRVNQDFEKLFGAEMAAGLKSNDPTIPLGLGSVARAQMSADIVDASKEVSVPSLTTNLHYEEHVKAEAVA